LKMIETELPVSLKQEMTVSLNDIDVAKQNYDSAKRVYDNPSNSEEKKIAKDKMDKAGIAYSAAQDNVKSILKKKEELIKGITNVVLAAIKKIKKDNENNLDQIKKYETTKKDYLSDLFLAQDLDTSAVINKLIDTKIIDIFIDDNISINDDDRQVFLQKANAINKSRTEVIGKVVYKTFTDFFEVPTNITDSLMTTPNIAGKELIDQLIAKQQNKEPTDALILFAFDFLNNELKKYTDNLSK